MHRFASSCLSTSSPLALTVNLVSHPSWSSRNRRIKLLRNPSCTEAIGKSRRASQFFEAPLIPKRNILSSHFTTTHLPRKEGWPLRVLSTIGGKGSTLGHLYCNAHPKRQPNLALRDKILTTCELWWRRSGFRSGDPLSVVSDLELIYGIYRKYSTLSNFNSKYQRKMDHLQKDFITILLQREETSKYKWNWGISVMI